jgi:hypothetical protein
VLTGVLTQLFELEFDELDKPRACIVGESRDIVASSSVATIILNLWSL